ncbi:MULTISPECIES: bifunctional metallophosphatase/5'-nucleotidase [Streptomyces]|uniref:5-nucleotidase n=1 Tax=Streptomyces venezuelae (strain ATCC 10712 / CBS 650.69 / DSM 40230 / JCM 4526 / NBRC 13096 / PD 04745) TaxID=953739 RepID=F2RFP3_STRVP|nr:bifunctional metallophosphatase/5'-nucleotidase [Streptomyces venezuelae]APE22934.1 bifunctional metallophosphatase/5'-nucleotidase [Streptomyces venezuelae]QES00314.1 bifunctional metallophosphatase/5'-nucleotidase [Streptomyces venezuelae ATCC 10712]QES07390.1 bifunctional metallophosphatase/5'-nucleotidase [Streptomyces venezuelae]CCA57195.1 5-nucleotidase [Streptomyces venezuelae ATCC 10712]
MAAKPRKNKTARRVLAAGAGLVTVGALVAAMPSAGAGVDTFAGHGKDWGRMVDVQLLSFNDLHGTLEPPAGSSGQVTRVKEDGTTEKVDAGGVEYLATHLRQARQGNRYSITAAAGDLIGASPLLSGLFHDEPMIGALNKLDLDVTSVGNHEFDEGAVELARMQNGGCHPTAGCYVKGKTFQGADFPYLAANVTKEKTGKPLLDPYFIWEKNGVRIGFIGVTLEGTPNVVTAEGVKGLKFGDEVETINKYTKILERKGVKSIVALVHEGGMPASSAYNYNCDGDGDGDGEGVSGAIVDIAKNVSPQVDALVTGHTHQAYVCSIPDPSGKPRLVTSASSFGKLYTDTTLTYDRRTKDIVRTAVASANHVVSRDVPKAADMTKLIGDWQTLAAPIANRPQGWIAADINGRGSTAYEKPLGDVIADAQLEGLAPADKGGAQLALMNPGGIRADLVHKASGAEGDGVVTYGESFTVQPFTNMMNVVDLSGANLIAALKQQVSGSNLNSVKILQVSKGLTYTLDMTKTGADRVVDGTIKLNGAAIDPSKTYRVAMNEFLAGGGDGFAALATGTNKLVGASDLDVFNAYLAAHSSAAAPLAVPAADRITVVQ